MLEEHSKDIDPGAPPSAMEMSMNTSRQIHFATNALDLWSAPNALARFVVRVVGGGVGDAAHALLLALIRALLLVTGVRP